MAKRRPTDDEVDEFRGRMAFLEEMWGVTTEYEVDTATGMAWVRIRRPDSPVAISVCRFHIYDFLLPAAR